MLQICSLGKGMKEIIARGLGGVNLYPDYISTESLKMLIKRQSWQNVVLLLLNARFYK